MEGADEQALHKAFVAAAAAGASRDKTDATGAKKLRSPLMHSHCPDVARAIFVIPRFPAAAAPEITREFSLATLARRIQLGVQRIMNAEIHPKDTYYLGYLVSQFNYISLLNYYADYLAPIIERVNIATLTKMHKQFIAAQKADPHTAHPPPPTISRLSEEFTTTQNAIRDALNQVQPPTLLPLPYIGDKPITANNTKLFARLLNTVHQLTQWYVTDEETKLFYERDVQSYSIKTFIAFERSLLLASYRGLVPTYIPGCQSASAPNATSGFANQLIAVALSRPNPGSLGEEKDLRLRAANLQLESLVGEAFSASNRLPEEVAQDEAAFLRHLTREITSFSLKNSPSAEVKAARQELVERVRRAASRVQEYRNCSVSAFGSAFCNFDLNSSDIDICIYSAVPSEENIARLSEGAAKRSLYRLRAVLSNQLLESIVIPARIPVLRAKYRASNGVILATDIVISSYLHLRKSLMLDYYGKYDSRVVPLARAVKHWAKMRSISDASLDWLPSYGYILLLLNYLQQLQIPIIPAFAPRKDKSKTLSLIDLHAYPELAPRLLLTRFREEAFIAYPSLATAHSAGTSRTHMRRQSMSARFDEAGVNELQADVLSALAAAAAVKASSKAANSKGVTFVAEIDDEAEEDADSDQGQSAEDDEQQQERELAEAAELNDRVGRPANRQINGQIGIQIPPMRHSEWQEHCKAELSDSLYYGPVYGGASATLGVRPASGPVPRDDTFEGGVPPQILAQPHRDSESSASDSESKKINWDSAGKLLMGFFEFYAKAFRPEFMCVSVRAGHFLWADQVRQHQLDGGFLSRFNNVHLCIEDPLDPSDNVGRMIKPGRLGAIMLEFTRAFQMLKDCRPFLHEVCEPWAVSIRSLNKFVNQGPTAFASSFLSASRATKNYRRVVDCLLSPEQLAKERQEAADAQRRRASVVEKLVKAGVTPEAVVTKPAKKSNAARKKTQRQRAKLGKKQNREELEAEAKLLGCTVEELLKTEKGSKRDANAKSQQASMKRVRLEAQSTPATAAPAVQAAAEPVARSIAEEPPSQPTSSTPDVDNSAQAESKVIDGTAVTQSEPIAATQAALAASVTETLAEVGLVDEAAPQDETQADESLEEDEDDGDAAEDEDGEEEDDEFHFSYSSRLRFSPFDNIDIVSSMKAKLTEPVQELEHSTEVDDEAALDSSRIALQRSAGMVTLYQSLELDGEEEEFDAEDLINEIILEGADDDDDDEAGADDKADADDEPEDHISIRQDIRRQSIFQRRLSFQQMLASEPESKSQSDALSMFGLGSSPSISIGKVALTDGATGADDDDDDDSPMHIGFNRNAE